MNPVMRVLRTCAATATILFIGCSSSNNNSNCSASGSTSGGGIGGIGGATMATGGSCSASSMACAAAASDTVCGTALKTKCCDQVTACDSDPSCVTCVQQGCATSDLTTANLLTCACQQPVCAQLLGADCQ